MSLTWHIIRKDLRRLWPWLALFITAILARYIIGWNLEHSAALDSVRYQRTASTELMLLCLQLLLGALFTAQLIHEDTTNSDRPFWITRPIGGLRLVSAKIVTLLLALGLLPLIAILTWWRLHHFGPSEILACLPDFAARQATLIAGSFTIALFTRTLGGFILAAVITPPALWVLLTAAARRTYRISPILIQSHAILCATVLTCALVACVVLKYRRRKAHLTTPILILSLIATSATAAWWPFDLLASFRSPSIEPGAAASIALQLSAEIPPSTDSAVLDFKLNGVPSAHRIDMRGLKLRIHSPGTTTDLRFSSLALSPVYDATDQPNVNPLKAPHRYTYRTPLPRTPAPATSLEVTARATLRREEIVADLPIVTGAQARNGLYTTRVIEADTSGERRSIDLLSTIPARQNPADGVAESHTGTRLTDFIGLNPPRRTRRLFITGGRPQAIDGTLQQRSLQIDHVLYMWENFYYTPSADPAVDRLLHVVYPLLGRFERSASVPLPPK